MSVVTVLGLFVFIDLALFVSLSLSIPLEYWRKCGWPARERTGRERWIKESERLEGCREVEAEGRVERQKGEGKAGQGKGRDKTMWHKWQRK